MFSEPSIFIRCLIICIAIMDELLQTIESVTKTIIADDVKAKLAGMV